MREKFINRESIAFEVLEAIARSRNTFGLVPLGEHSRSSIVKSRKARGSNKTIGLGKDWRTQLIS